MEAATNWREFHNRWDGFWISALRISGIDIALRVDAEIEETKLGGR
jgi:hypothetical protein